MIPPFRFSKTEESLIGRCVCNAVRNVELEPGKVSFEEERSYECLPCMRVTVELIGLDRWFAIQFLLGEKSLSNPDALVAELTASLNRRKGEFFRQPTQIY